MLESRRDQRFAKETELGCVASAEKLFDRDIATKLAIVCAPYETETPTALLSADLVALALAILQRSRDARARCCHRRIEGGRRRPHRSCCIVIDHSPVVLPHRAADHSRSRKRGHGSFPFSKSDAVFRVLSPHALVPNMTSTTATVPVPTLFRSDPVTRSSTTGERNSSIWPRVPHVPNPLQRSAETERRIQRRASPSQQWSWDIAKLKDG
jgi:hypothetical protein